VLLAALCILCISIPAAWMQGSSPVDAARESHIHPDGDPPSAAWTQDPSRDPVLQPGRQTALLNLVVSFRTSDIDREERDTIRDGDEGEDRRGTSHRSRDDDDDDDDDERKDRRKDDDDRKGGKRDDDEREDRRKDDDDEKDGREDDDRSPGDGSKKDTPAVTPSGVETQKKSKAVEETPTSADTPAEGDKAESPTPSSVPQEDTADRAPPATATPAPAEIPEKGDDEKLPAPASAHREGRDDGGRPATATTTPLPPVTPEEGSSGGAPTEESVKSSIPAPAPTVTHPVEEASSETLPIVPDQTIVPVEAPPEPEQDASPPPDTATPTPAETAALSEHESAALPAEENRTDASSGAEERTILPASRNPGSFFTGHLLSRWGRMVTGTDRSAVSGLVIRGVGMSIAGTPEDIRIDPGSAGSNRLSALLHEEMRREGRRPRVVRESEMFEVSVTVEAGNPGYTGEEMYVVLVPPPMQAGVYRVLLKKIPDGLAPGERAVWLFDVTCLSATVDTANLTGEDAAWLANLTENPDLYAFGAVAFVRDQQNISSVRSDPVISVRSSTDAPGSVSGRTLPEWYRSLQVESSTLPMHTTLHGAREAGTAPDEIAGEAGLHLERIRHIGEEDLIALHAAQSPPSPEPGDAPSAAGLLAAALQNVFAAIREFLQALIISHAPGSTPAGGRNSR